MPVTANAEGFGAWWDFIGGLVWCESRDICEETGVSDPTKDGKLYLMKGEYVALVFLQGYITGQEGTKHLRVSDTCLYKGFLFFLLPGDFLQIP